MASSPMQPIDNGNYWTHARLELAEWLRLYAPSLSELYRAALQLLYGTPVPGRFVLVSHAVREIRNRLPERVSGLMGEGRLDYTSRVASIAEQWEREGLGMTGDLPLTPPAIGAEPSASDGSNSSLPPQIVTLIAKLVNDHARAHTRTSESARRLFAAATGSGEPIPAPVVKQWVQTTNWFMGHAHDSGKVDDDFDEELFLSRFRLFEESLFAVSRPFFPNLDELDAILADTHS